ncbi:MAG: 3-deoxy-7-phosphoheptulonate synthase, partial [Candidatus Omnitrophota bacterium]
MIVVFKKEATQKEIDHVIERVEKLGLKALVSRGTERTIMGIIGPEDAVRMQPLEAFSGVEKVM